MQNLQRYSPLFFFFFRVLETRISQSSKTKKYLNLGRGAIEEEQTIEVTVPAGCEEGEYVVFEGKADQEVWSQKKKYLTQIKKYLT